MIKSKMFKTSKFIAVEGPDGSGKSTQIDLLINYLKSEGVETKFIHFPRSSEGVFGELISKFLRGEFGKVENVHPQMVALLFAEDRREFSTTILEWLENGYFVLVDRYVLSNIAFQCAKLKNQKEKRELRKWINMFEYEYNQIPRPNLSLYLDVPFSFIEKSLTTERSGIEREYLNGMEDIHEKDISLQLAVKEEYETLANLDNTIHKIICYNSRKEMKSVSEINDEIIRHINRIIGIETT
jgi:dTMP kinase